MAVAAVVLAGAPAAAQVSWTGQAYVVWPGPPGEWDDGFHSVGGVLFDGATYHMYLVGGHDIQTMDGWAVGHWTAEDVSGPWTADSTNPVLEPGPPGSWDDHSIVSTAVLFQGAAFHMWYAAVQDGGPYRVGYATSANGSIWDKHAGNPLEDLDPGAPGSWYDNGVFPSAVLAEGSTHHLWFTGESTASEPWRLGHAWSSDGLSWTMHPDPVVEPVELWEHGSVYFPEVVEMGPYLGMWYTGMDPVGPPTPFVCMGYAISQDGIVWGKYPWNPVLEPAWPPSNVLYSWAAIVEGDTVHAWTSVGDDIGYATAPVEVIFFDGFETGDTDFWPVVVP
jgi:hypothetical protein